MQASNALQEKAALVRKWSLISTTEAGSGHPTSCLSAADITTVLFDKYFTYDISQPLNIYNDRFVLSKGHAAPLLYTLFGMAGAYPLEELKTLRKFGSRFEGHPVPKYVYAEAATGSLGQGLSVGAGLALVAQKEKLPFKTYVLMGDGEVAEGQIWEAANFASWHTLENLIAILDANRFAQSDETMFGHHIQQYVNRFKGFGFETIAIDGHNMDEIDKALQQAVSNKSGRPVAIIAKTLKGKGVSFIEDKPGWHGKALKKDELKKALEEIGDVSDSLRFDLKKPVSAKLPASATATAGEARSKPIEMSFDKNKEYATREVFGEVLAKMGDSNKEIYTLDADVKNSTFTQDFLRAHEERFVECFIAEQNMVSVAAGLSRLGKIPFVATFAAFFTRAADQIRMARVSEANIKFVGSHVGVSIGEDGPSQMGLEDIALFGTLPGSAVLQPADAACTAKLVPQMADYPGIAYMRTLRPKTAVLYDEKQDFSIGGSQLLRHSEDDVLTIAATGITVFEALKAADQLEKEGIHVRVLDCYSIKPIDKDALIKSLHETKLPIIITVEDHFAHGGMGDFADEALEEMNIRVHKMAVTDISESGTMEELLKKAGIDATNIVGKVKQMAGAYARQPLSFHA